MQKRSQISVVMVEDNVGITQTVIDFLNEEPRIKVLAQSREEKSFQENIGMHLPDVALIDIGLTHSRSGLDLLSWLAQEYPVVKPVIMSVNEGDVMEAYQKGALGFVLKSQLEILVKTIVEVSEGKLIIPTEVSNLYVKQVAAASSHFKKYLELEQFSEREKEILLLLKQGVDRELISDKLNISFYTVRRHIQNILAKTGETSIRSVLSRFGNWLSPAELLSQN